MTEPARSLRILLADDHVIVRHGLKLLIDGQPDMTVIAEVSDRIAVMHEGAISLMQMSKTSAAVQRFTGVASRPAFLSMYARIRSLPRL